MAPKKKTSTNYRPRGRQAIKEQVLSTDPTKDYKYSRPNFWGETMVQGLPPWRIFTGRMMMDSDPVVRFCLNVRNAALMPAEIEVKCKNEQVKQWIEEQWNVVWNYYRDKITSAKKFGFAALQVDWKLKNGLMAIKRIKDFAPEDIRGLQKNNKTVGWSVKSKQVYFPRALWLTFNSEYGNAYGMGCLRRQYPAWYEKWMDHGAKRLLQLRMIKDSYIGDIFWYPPNLLVELPDGTKMSWKDLMREMAENRLSGGALTLPILYDDNGKELTKYSPPQDTSGGSQIFEWNDLCDRGIFQGADVPLEVVEASQTGSGYSGRSIPFLTMLSVANSEFGEILKCFDECCLRTGAWLNWGGDVDYELKPKNLVETFSDDTQGSPMGGAAVGGQPSSAPPQPNTNSPPQQQSGAVQFWEELASFKKGVEVAVSLGLDNLSPSELIKLGAERLKKEIQFGEKHKFSSTQFDITGQLGFEIVQLGAMIPSEDLQPTDYGDVTDTGREMNPHVTVKYGLHTNEADEVKEALLGAAPVAIQLGKTSCFYSEEYDVVKIDVHSKALHTLNGVIAEYVECTDTYPDYKPHITIAYVKKGLGDLYAKRLNSLEGKVAVFDTLTFSNKFREHTKIPLTGNAQFDEIGFGDKHLRAPPGGVTIHGVSYKGGEFIPKEVMAELSPGEKRKLRAGTIARHIKANPNLAEKPEAAKVESKPATDTAKPSGEEKPKERKPPDLEAAKAAVAKIEETYVPFDPEGKDSMSRHTTKEGKWTVYRKVLHDSILSKYDKMAKPVDGRPEYVMMGGGPASGKSSIIRSGAVKFAAGEVTYSKGKDGKEQTHYPEGLSMINADEVKELLPEYEAMSHHGDHKAAAYAHEESSYLTKKIMAQSLQKKSHAVLDGTGDASIESLKQKVDQARAAGHKVRAEYVTCPTDMAVARAKKGGDETGRYIPEAMLRDSHKGVSRILPQAIQEGFFDEVNLWDTSGGGKPVLVASGKGKNVTIHDQEKWNAFLKKAEE